MTKKNEAKKFILLIINGRVDTWKESRTNVIKITKQHWWINWIRWMFSRFARLRLNVIRSPYITNVCLFIFFSSGQENLLFMKASINCHSFYLTVLQNYISSSSCLWYFCQLFNYDLLPFHERYLHVGWIG